MTGFIYGCRIGDSEHMGLEVSGVTTHPDTLPLRAIGILRQGANFTHAHLPNHFVFSIWCLSYMGNGYIHQITGTLIAVATQPVIDPNVPTGGCDTLLCVCSVGLFQQGSRLMPAMFTVLRGLL